MKLTTNPVFRDHYNKEISDIRRFVNDWLQYHPRGEIYVGCDSKARGKLVKYSTVVCMWDVGNGVAEIFKNEVVPNPPDPYTRLWDEVTRAVSTAEYLRELSKITVHVDINSKPGYRSHQLYDASIGLITSLGFEAAGKPFSWAASCGAHRHCQ